MLSEIDVLRDISAKLDQLGFPYMLTGSMAMNYYAVPRMTRDLDSVIVLPPALAGKLTRSLESGSEQQRQDIENLLPGNEDDAYLKKWAAKLGVDRLLQTFTGPAA